ncbi:MAG TPA: HYR domain-containing protein [Methylomirabilota bacterium]|nr:HYR domain-containing protein [Methylomirabilota bacterium]
MGARRRSARARVVSVLLTIVALTAGFSGSALGATHSTTGATAPQGPHADPKDPPFGHGKAVGNKHLITDELSAMGRLAQKQQAKDAKKNGHKFLSLDKDLCDLDCPDDVSGDPDFDGPAGGQAETSMAVDSTGAHVVVGFNDTRGFSLSTISVSGFMYSDDGGATFIDGGQLPTPGLDVIGTTHYPQVFGDPEVKYLGGSTFAYVSILVKKLNATGTAQTMGLHVSADYGHTWSGPYEIGPATNPHGQLSSTTNSARDAADKEFADWDPVSGRMVLSWSNFTSTAFAPAGVEITTTFSDNILTANPPTWSARAIVAATANDGQASIPRFGDGGNAYVAWRRFFPGTNQNAVGFARSTNNGASWSTPINTSGSFFTMDYVLGNDRVNTSPALAVDRGGGARNGYIYLVYANNANHDGADIAFQRSTDGGLTFSPSILLNSRPGSDRPQWFPWVTVDNSSGRVYVFYYDQGIASTGDLTETTYLFSDDGGTTWSAPRPLSKRPFHAGWGNDTGQPNLGDYNQAVAQNGLLSTVWAETEQKGFADGQPTSASFTTPDVAYRRVAANTPRAQVRLGNVTFTDSGGGGNGSIDASERVTLTFPLNNYVTNALSAATLTGITATLTTATAGVLVTQGTSAYPNLAAGASANNTTAFVLQTSTGFVLGTPIELTLTVASAQGPATLLATLLTGTPGGTAIFSENFNGVLPGTLPAGWSSVHNGGTVTVPWTTSNTFCASATNGAFHSNNNDAPNPMRFERLFSPLIDVPAGAEYVTLEFDVCYDTEDDPDFNILAYDGFTVRITDQTPTGRLARSVLPEAFETILKTGSIDHYPKHFPRFTSPAYFEDMSVWAGDSAGLKHVFMRLPGMAGSTVQLRFEYAQDSFGNCIDVRPTHTSCGVLVDNIVMKSVVSIQPTDTTPPVLTIPSDQIFEATSPAGTLVTFQPCSATDDFLVVTVTNAPNPSTFPLGTTVVSCSATDAAGNLASGTFKVTLRDTTPPVVTTPPDQIAEATSPSGATVTYPACTATDTVSPVSITYTQASGATFALGDTVVICTATDLSGNFTNGTFDVIVVDTTRPTITAPPAQTVEATSAAGAIVSYGGCTATDTVGPVTISYSQASGTIFPLGTTTVTCTATDASANASSATFQISVVDTTRPTISAPPTQTFEATSAAGAIVSYVGCTATDTVGPVTISYSQASGTTFPLGDTTVTCTATDAAGNASSATFHVIVRDTTKPVVTFTGNATPYTVDQTVNIVCSFSDAVGVVSNTCRNFSGPAYSFGIGVTSYTATATDAAANTGSATLQFEVRSTSASLCALTTLFSSKEGIAKSLCAKLEAAAAALERGNTKTHDNILNAYKNEVSAQSGKAISIADAAILIAAAGSL